MPQGAPRLIVRRKLTEEEDAARYLTTQYVRLKPYIIIEGENRTWPNQDLNQLRKVRREKLANLVAEGKNPFEIVTYDQDHHTKEILDNYEVFEGKEVSIAGRLMQKRVMGKASFANVQDRDGNIQIYVSRDDLGEDYPAFKKLDVGDIIGVKGFVFTTQKGERSIHAKEITLLSKSLQILPEGEVPRTHEHRSALSSALCRPDHESGFEGCVHQAFEDHFRDSPLPR